MNRTKLVKKRVMIDLVDLYVMGVIGEKTLASVASDIGMDHDTLMLMVEEATV